VQRKPLLTAKPKLTDAERHKRFVETAQKIDASDKLEEFDKAFDKLVIRASCKKIDEFSPVRL
jgi:hypothetical protein